MTEEDSVMGGFCNLFRAYGEIASMSKRKPQRGDFTNGGAEKVWKEIILRRSTGMKITPTLEECKRSQRKKATE